MNDIKRTWGLLVMVGALVLAVGLVSGQAFAQGPMNTGPIPGVVPAANSGLPLVPVPVPNLNNPQINNLLGTALGSFLGYMAQNNMYNRDRDYYYYHDRDPYRYPGYYGYYRYPYYGNPYYYHDPDDYYYHRDRDDDDD